MIFEVGVDDIEPTGGAPGHGDGVLHVTRDVARVTTPPQADVDGRYQLVGNLRVAGGDERNLMTALVQLLTERRNHSLRARVGRRWNG